MSFASPKDLRSVPNATGGIARLACARMREAGVSMAAVLAEAGLTVAQVNDPTFRLEVSTQIRFLELAAAELQDDILGFHLHEISTCVRLVCSTTSWPLPIN